MWLIMGPRYHLPVGALCSRLVARRKRDAGESRDARCRENRATRRRLAPREIQTITKSPWSSAGLLLSVAKWIETLPALLPSAS
jgi:hypothetical protein